MSLPLQETEPTYHAVDVQGNLHESARQQLQATSFNPQTVEFLTEIALSHGDMAMDLGSGIGQALPILGKYADDIVAVDMNGDRLRQAQPIIDSLRESGVTVTQMEGSVASLVDVADGSVDVIYARLFWMYLPEDVRQQGMAECMRVLKPGGRVIFEDFDLDQWRMDPPSEAHGQLRDAYMMWRESQSLVRNGMGIGIAAMCTDAGLTVTHTRNYQIESSGEDAFKRAHIGLFRSAERALVDGGFMTQDQFDGTMKQFEQDILHPATVAYSPEMYQVAAVKG